MWRKTLAQIAMITLGGCAQANATGSINDLPTHAELTDATEIAAQKKQLTAEQYHVTQESGTELPFHNQYWDNHAPGIYVDVVSGEPLFSSQQKFESGTGWPSFWAPLEKKNVTTQGDNSLGMSRDEVRSKHANSHLGHLFDDGPQPTGLRYCMNSASMRFIPADRLQATGYGKYAALFPDIAQVTPATPAHK